MKKLIITTMLIFGMVMMTTSVSACPRGVGVPHHNIHNIHPSPHHHYYHMTNRRRIHIPEGIITIFFNFR